MGKANMDSLKNKLTEEEALRLLNNTIFLDDIGYGNTLNRWRENGWIKKSEADEHTIIKEE